MKNLVQSYRILSENVHIFNSLFGYQIILIMFHFGIEVVNGLNSIFISFVISDVQSYYGYILLGSACVFIVMMHNLLIIIIPIHSTMQEGRRFVDLFGKLQEEVSEGSCESKSLLKWATISQQYVPDFSAAVESTTWFLTNMNFRRSIKDINFIKYLFLFLNLPLVTPWYDFDRQSSYKPKLQKAYGMILMSGALLRLIYMKIGLKNVGYITNLSISENFTWSCANVILTLITCLAIFRSCFLDVGKWKMIFTNLRCIDKSLKNVGKDETYVLRNFYLIFFLKQLVFFVAICVGQYVWASLMHLSILKVIIVTCVFECYYEFFLITVINALVQSFKSRYQNLNHRVLVVFQETKTVQKWRALAQDYRILGETVDVFNEMFGWQIVLMMFHFGLEMVSTLYFNFRVLVGKGKADLIGRLGNFGLWIWMLCNFLSIVLPIHDIHKESRKFIGLLYKMQDYFEEGSMEMGALNRLISYSKNFAPKFNGAGFFSINRAIIFSVLANVGMYVVIMFQIDYSEVN
ncbi:hypothetical protein Zmor_019959 [Zophobas morio]|uniref:Gustatory receptor n=1 Tax=Zophobas morio TaxID=2755281 RepID=A0AA38I0Q4_9CUCU|nr:hypothetical protein Zmor_019959 [Zophobas morio]